MQDATETKPDPTPLHRCLAELALELTKYSGGYVQHGDRVLRTYDRARLLGRQADGRYAYRFGHEDDAADFRDDAMRICAFYGIDVGATIQPYRDSTADVMLELEDLEPCHLCATTPTVDETTEGRVCRGCSERLTEEREAEEKAQRLYEDARDAGRVR